MGALICFWDSYHMDIGAKALIYLVIPIDLLLWGCQSWTLTKVLTKKVEVFYVRCLRCILKIKWVDVRKLKINNFKSEKNLKIWIRLKI